MDKEVFGLRLRKYRKDKGLTIEKLAEQIGLSPQLSWRRGARQKAAQHGDLYPPGQYAGCFGR